MSAIMLRLQCFEKDTYFYVCRYLYCGEISLKNETAVPTLYAAKKYMMPHLAEICVEHLEKKVEPNNVCLLLSQSHLFDETELMQRCWDVIDTQTEDVFQSDDFTDIDHKTLQEILGRQTLCIDETKVFAAAKQWAEAECLRQGRDPSPQQCREVLGDALYLIRFPTMTPGDFADGAGQSGLLSVQETNDLFFNFTARKKPKLQFPITPRKGRPLCCQRFKSVCAGGMKFGTRAECIEFSVNKDISVVGFGLYGKAHTSMKRGVLIAILHDNEILCQQVQDMYSDGSRNTVHMLFDTPLRIEADTKYMAIFCTKIASIDICGVGGMPRVNCGGVNFTFTTVSRQEYPEASCLTNVAMGQIPEILFYRWHWCDAILMWYNVALIHVGGIMMRQMIATTGLPLWLTVTHWRFNCKWIFFKRISDCSLETFPV